MDAEAFADELAAAIQYTIRAHSKFSNTPREAVRLWDSVTPYAIHPIWCATTVLTETTLPESIRYPGYLALLWHDILEDTQLGLPPDVRPEVRTLVEEMTFVNFEDELARLWERSDTTKLLKLYDKTSILLDAAWMSDARWNLVVEHTQKLLAFVLPNYGELNIVRMARAICVMRDSSLVIRD
ncbi:MAG: hypothetical protein ACJ8CR_16755 [Roseiflexaceae bacterium]